MRRFAKPLSGVTCSEGSNPSLSASLLSEVRSRARRGPGLEDCARSSVDRASGCGPEGRGFESRRARHQVSSEFRPAEPPRWPYRSGPRMVFRSRDSAARVHGPPAANRRRPRDHHSRDAQRRRIRHAHRGPWRPRHDRPRTWTSRDAKYVRSHDQTWTKTRAGLRCRSARPESGSHPGRWRHPGSSAGRETATPSISDSAPVAPMPDARRPPI